MLRQGREIADSLVVIAICIGLPAVALSYARNIPDRAAHTAQAEDAVPAWIDPETTGAITPKAEAASAHVEASPSELTTGSTTWVDPPSRSTAGERSVPVIDETMELRLPRP